MKKIAMFAVAALFSAVSFAQTSTPPTVNPDKKQDMKDLRKDVKDVRKDEKQRREELKEGDKAGAKQITKEIKKDKRDIHHDARDLKEDGVKHPIRRADRQIRNHRH